MRELLDSGERSAIFPSQEERNTQILLILLNRSDYVTANELAEWLGTSRNTILRDLLKGERMLQQWNLDLERKQYKGFKVKGPELYKRLLLEYLAQNLLDASDMFRMIQGVLRREPIPPDIKNIGPPSSSLWRNGECLSGCSQPDQDAGGEAQSFAYGSGNDRTVVQIFHCHPANQR
ncbi:HTH domain-containing protein [Paenibacillus larvae]|uniref:HTH domain-containing protein n=1 Tax=Paenibacillus larvae TaxID=1464 RepID=UPI002891D6B3|nr:HTH domain-containing protein [Paenibacillus larvae]MDT2191522.1 HTH domain-containing protein [Paenibacillus larvae]